MARSFSNVKLVSALISDGVSVALNRSTRSYSPIASQGVVARSGAMMKQGGGGGGGGGEEKGKPEVSSPWVPDPVTGYYRPENRAAEISVAELREMLLNNKTRQP